MSVESPTPAQADESTTQSWWVRDFDGLKADAQARMRREVPSKKIQVVLDNLLLQEEAELRGFPTPRNPLSGGERGPLAFRSDRGIRTKAF